MEKSKKRYISLSEYTDIERKTYTEIIAKFQAKYNVMAARLRGVSNILRTPRLTEMFHRRMRDEVVSYHRCVEDLVNSHNLMESEGAFGSILDNASSSLF